MHVTLIESTVRVVLSLEKLHFAVAGELPCFCLVINRNSFISLHIQAFALYFPYGPI